MILYALGRIGDGLGQYWRWMGNTVPNLFPVFHPRQIIQELRPNHDKVGHGRVAEWAGHVSSGDRTRATARRFRGQGFHGQSAVRRVLAGNKCDRENLIELKPAEHPFHLAGAGWSTTRELPAGQRLEITRQRFSQRFNPRSTPSRCTRIGCRCITSRQIAHAPSSGWTRWRGWFVAGPWMPRTARYSKPCRLRTEYPRVLHA
jgi:hypothetical protein